MKTYCVKCRKDTDNIDSKFFKAKNNRLLMHKNVVIVKIQERTRKKRFIE